jgi:peptidoglycan/LPS O-acetylase OafA/YrhL
MIAPLLAVVLRIHGFGDVPATSQAPEGNSYWANLVRFNPLLRMPEFLMGILLARAYDGLFTGKSALLGRGYYLYVPGMILEIAMISQGNSIPAPLVHGGLFLPIHSLVILGLALGGGPPARLLSTRPIVFLGKASYSLYILHMPLFWWMDWIHRRVFSNPTRDTRLAVFHLLTVVSLSAIVFQFLEEPLSRIARRRFGLLFGVSDENRARSASAGG